jgi:hypothetical protein
LNNYEEFSLSTHYDIIHIVGREGGRRLLVGLIFEVQTGMADEDALNLAISFGDY